MIVITSLDELYDAVKGKAVKRIALAAAEDEGIIKLVKSASEIGIAEFILVGEAEKIRDLLRREGVDDAAFEIHDTDGHRAAAEKAVRLVVEGKASVVMKGELHTAVFLKAVLDKERGLRSGNLISQITVTEKVDGDGLLMFTDCAMNIAPTLEEKKQIVENAVGLAVRLGYSKPRVAVLSAVELVNPAMQDTLDAAILSKMADRGQIEHAVVDGPFALDNAISVTAARQKKIGGEVAGRADIVLVPNLQVGNAIHKGLTHLSGKKVAAAVMGARVPIVMTSRADTTDTKLFSIAIAAYIS
jgi:phosphate butyryltransferase